MLFRSKSLESTFGLRTLVVNSNITYLDEVFEGDRLTVLTDVELGDKSSMLYKQSINRNGGMVSTADITVVFVDKDKKPIRIPDDIRSKLK